MRLIRLHIPKWKNLQDFTIHFAEDAFTSVLVGRNGTGKSNVLEAISTIFRDLDLGLVTPFAYALEYKCRGETVTVDSDSQRSGADMVRIVVGGKSVPRQKFSRKGGGGEHLPNHVFMYYSGHSDRMSSLFEKHEQAFDVELREGKDQPLRPVLYVRPVQSKFALLSFFWKDDPKEQAFLNRYLRIEALESVLFILKRPYWHGSGRRPGEDPDRFWGAVGVVRDLLDKLYDLAFAPMRIQERSSKGQSHDRMYLFLRNKADLQKFAHPYKTPKEFFKALDSLHVADVVEDCRARVKITNVDGGLTFRELAEGEQQLLMVLGLLRYTREEEALILLDEPDTHLNPAWSLEYVELLREAIPNDDTSHVVMATHDPLVVAGLLKTQVHLMRRDARGTINVEHPERDPQGMGVAALLMSDVYGLRSELDPITLEKLELRRRLTFKTNLTSQEKATLADLNRWIESQDFATGDRDPLYPKFVEAMTQAEEEEGVQRPDFTTEQLKAQKKLALKIVKRLRSKASKES